MWELIFIAEFNFKSLFYPGAGPRDLHARMAEFSFLRVAREMPTLRELRPVAWPSGLRSAANFGVRFPDIDPINPELRVAVFDGGVPKGILPGKVLARKKSSSLGAAVPAYQAHGVGVTSALLYGSLEDGAALPRPFASVDHYRVIDKETKNDLQGHYFDVLNRIMHVLRQDHFEFVNLRLGPTFRLRTTRYTSGQPASTSIFRTARVLSRLPPETPERPIGMRETRASRPPRTVSTFFRSARPIVIPRNGSVLHTAR